MRFFILFIFFFSVGLNAREDSLSSRRLSPYDRWFVEHDPLLRRPIDTTIFNIEEYNHCQRDGIEFVHLGNLGSPAYSLVFQRPLVKGFQEGMQAFDVYRFKRDSVRYYHVKRPYTQIMYVIGLGNEQRFNGRFAHRYKDIIYYGVEYDRLYSKGAYPNQLSNHNGFSLYGLFHSRDKHWDVQTNLLFNDFKMGENGGTTSDIFRSDSVPISSSLSSVNSTSGRNYHNEITYILKGNYNFLESPKKETDSLVSSTPSPVFRLGYEFMLKRKTYRYSDINPDSLFYRDFLSVDADSASYFLQTLSIENRVSFEFTGKRVKNDVQKKPLNLVTGISVGANWVRWNDIRGANTFVNSDIQAFVRSNPDAGKRFTYHIDACWFISGFNQHDASLIVKGSYSLPKLGLISGLIRYSQEENSLIYQRFSNPGITWTRSPEKMRTTEGRLAWEMTKWGLQISASYFLLQNTPYFSAADRPEYDPSLIHVGVAHLSHRLAVKGFHLDNDVFFQYASSSTPIRFPWMVSRHSVYYETRLFKKALWLSTGFDLRYQTSFRANAYFPLTGQFYLQDQRIFSYYPVLDFFLNFKIRTVRIFMKVDNISGLFGPRGYYNASLYPSRNLSFRVGIIWRFFE